MAVDFGNAHRYFIDIAHYFAGQRVFLGTVGNNSSGFQENNAIHLGWDLIEVMRDDDYVLPRSSQTSYVPQVVETGGDVEP